MKKPIDIARELDLTIPPVKEVPLDWLDVLSRSQRTGSHHLRRVFSIGTGNRRMIAPLFAAALLAGLGAGAYFASRGGSDSPAGGMVYDTQLKTTVPAAKEARLQQLRAQTATSQSASSQTATSQSANAQASSASSRTLTTEIPAPAAAGKLWNAIDASAPAPAVVLSPTNCYGYRDSSGGNIVVCVGADGQDATRGMVYVLWEDSQGAETTRSYYSAGVGAWTISSVAGNVLNLKSASGKVGTFDLQQQAKGVALG